MYDPNGNLFGGDGRTITFDNLDRPIDGRVLVVAGQNSGSSRYLASAEIYDSATGSFAPTGSLSRVSLTHAATLLGNGTVLVAGGDGTNAAQIYDPGTGMFRATGSMINTRGGPQATLLANGKVLFTGGIGPPYGDGVVAAESYDPASETFTPAGAAIGCHSTATRLPNGMVLLAGGGPVICSGIYSSDVGAELYDPTKGTFDFTINMNLWREEGHTATRLPDGKVLFTGGVRIVPQGTSATIYTAELFSIP